jgi:hypothetical protein
MSKKSVLSELRFASERLLLLLRGSDPKRRAWAARALGRFYSVTDDVLIALGEALFDEHEEVSWGAGVSLFGYGDKSRPALVQLVRALDHRDARVVSLAAATLSCFGPAAAPARRALLRLAESVDPRVACWAKHALEKIDRKE